ncbi:MAG: hypothetical protein H0U57_07180 [Tatlockia sp.]|nr:hypothetical protein [Tatlockia sp.]
MSKIKLVLLSSVLVSGVSFAAPACDSFEVKLKNNLADDLLITNIKLEGAKIQPNFIEKLASKTAQVFTINGSDANVPMTGEFTLHTISLPIKTVKINYTLNNGTVCTHNDASPLSDYAVDKQRKIGQVEYSISNK